jgi:hypothetical protein
LQQVIDAKILEGEFSYRTIVKPSTVTQKLAPALDHFFNHQTHHRGQAHCLLTAIGGQGGGPFSRSHPVSARDGPGRHQTASLILNARHRSIGFEQAYRCLKRFSPGITAPRRAFFNRRRHRSA